MMGAPALGARAWTRVSHFHLLLWHAALCQVLGTIYAVSSVASSSHGYAGACIGIKISDKNEREFDEATINAGKAIMGGQMGYTAGESQSGMSMGKTRKVCD